MQGLDFFFGNSVYCDGLEARPRSIRIRAVRRGKDDGRDQEGSLMS